MNDLIPVSAQEDSRVMGVEQNDVFGGKQVILRFVNGYGISVVNHAGSYGTELAVLHSAIGIRLCYATPITSDVVKHIPSAEKVAEYAAAVAALPRNDECYHQRPEDAEDYDLGDFMDSLDSMARMAGRW